MKFKNLLNYNNTTKHNKLDVNNFIGVFILIFSFITFSYSQNNIGINTTGATPNNKALLDINADNATGEKKGVLIPRLTTVERDALSSSVGPTPESLLIYNTTTSCYEAWNQNTPYWVALSCLNCLLPVYFEVPESREVSTTSTSFTASWSASANATGYYLDVSTSPTFATFVAGYNNFSTGNVVSVNVTGLTVGTYYYRVRATNACGTSANSSIVLVKIVTCSSQGESDYGIVTTTLFGSTRQFITRNLGAAFDPLWFADTSDRVTGCFFQFNRSQGYIIDNGAGSSVPMIPTGAISENSDWTLANDPCALQLGAGWRIPTRAEWDNLNAGYPPFSEWSTATVTYPFNYLSYLNLWHNDIKLTYNKMFHYGPPTALDPYYNMYWSSTQFAASLGYVYSSCLQGCGGWGTPKADLINVRCIK